MDTCNGFTFQLKIAKKVRLSLMFIDLGKCTLFIREGWNLMEEAEKVERIGTQLDKMWSTIDKRLLMKMGLELTLNIFFWLLLIIFSSKMIKCSLQLVFHIQLPFFKLKFKNISLQLCPTMDLNLMYLLYALHFADKLLNYWQLNQSKIHSLPRRNNLLLLMLEVTLDKLQVLGY